MRYAILMLLTAVAACGTEPTDPYAELMPTCSWVFFADRDGDGVGTNEDTVTACEPPVGYVARSGDCDDTDAAASPDGTEVCDGIDNDCDGLVDVDDPDVDLDTVATYYRDSDGDGFGNPSVTIDGCEMPAGYTNNDDDCDDYDDTAYPGAAEVCDNADNDCDGAWDEDDPDLDLDTAGTWYTDADGDGWGAGDAILACDRPSGTVEQSGDCDDQDAAAHPSATEICDGIDNDCDDQIDAAICDTFAGAYTGTYQHAAVERVGSVVVNQMSCSGPIWIDVEPIQSPALQGTFECQYSGGLGTFDATQPGTVEAEIDPDGNITGRVTHEYAYELEKSYAFTGVIVGGLLEASGSGSLLPHPQSAVPWEVDFSFSAD